MNLSLKPCAVISTGIFIVFALIAPQVWAHTETGVAGGLVSGFMHPVLGPDHLVAMVAVGLWGAQLRAPAIWLMPVAFPLLMAFGGVLGVLGLVPPMVELGVAGSALALGLAVMFCIRPPLPVAVGVVALFGVFHGFAHGAELPHASNALAYGVGFVVCTGLLHGLGIMLGLLGRWSWGGKSIRALGALVALTGAYFVAIALGLN